ncbi:hypothetical protein C9E92_09855 [Salmonella enterica subsp. enterica serovar Wilhelmsburg]|uniref:Uncharacterized protein n=1 Tax=Salmonella enterica subsp. enterica serovar Wilhelmsburg TaxID=1960126 RepID=A0A659RRF3_SALET|nr:hypothetical protein C9E92_09855 [Salmonella enterica subsp. enterica serovar Wilhelmsburg]TGC68028.1 hypothetical protein C9E98_03790 [Salmonella enterica subsp. enterica serovar Wilhelmsburg]TGC81755.1 hypothetical protein C9F09_22150 [Salmonella enterica subsp. enterica serovar Wilhelmsburg]TGC83307.1 hypothetical protein C9F02_22265 [Salmonella enterica subsp. enterica serovar Wilhelmsburg]TGC86148.1 hypothetical protein C9F04_11340 [Salmonella enterica subsp. enterica serovar Wilhelmsbu
MPSPQPKRYRHFAATGIKKGATFSRNPLFYLVLAGVEPASEIPTYHCNYIKNSKLCFKTIC